jgi:hypothetical protein
VTLVYGDGSKMIVFLYFSSIIKLYVDHFCQCPILRRMLVRCKVIEHDGVDSTSGLLILNESFVFSFAGCLFFSGTGLSLYCGKGVKYP